jgi:transcriptional regulator of acetoin/glycerol metabolism
VGDRSGSLATGRSALASNHLQENRYELPRDGEDRLRPAAAVPRFERLVTLRQCVDSLGWPRPSRRLRRTAEEIAHEVQRQGNVTAAARKLGMSRTTVYRYLECAAAIATTGAADLTR